MNTLTDIKTNGIEKMTTKDALSFYKAIGKNFPHADTIFTNDSISYGDKKYPKMFKVELTLQVFEDKKEKRYIAKLSRGIDWSCSNGVFFIELCPEDFNTELSFQKKYNEIA
jgi:hypothetical protein